MAVIVRVAASLAVIGALAIAGGVALIHPPSGLIGLGLEAVVGAYVVAYLGARRPRR